mgnify:FL=1
MEEIDDDTFVSMFLKFLGYYSQNTGIDEDIVILVSHVYNGADLTWCQPVKIAERKEYC